MLLVYKNVVVFFFRTVALVMILAVHTVWITARLQGKCQLLN